ncbi:4-hydroxythreonine-4-phosphate dehydrogenase PdxA [Candidatus Pelagibacter sp.]|uniref:4-hydroxythreonine-4-phosphate dehydrogenase PdxA n=1 Tax=Candidatus Pelagibacter sp. TaxID=2024849 RepID=UPI003F84B6F9
MNTKIKPIIIIAGEPFSIFSEIFFKSIKKFNSKNPIVLIGSYDLFKSQMKVLKYKFKFNLIDKNFKIKDLKFKKIINIINVNFKFSNCFSKISNSSKNYIKNSFNIGLDISKNKDIAGIINGPISKKDFLNYKYNGITEYLSKKTKSKNVAMLIYSKSFSVSPLTTHISLRKVSKRINQHKIINNTILIKKFFKKYFKIDPRIFITGLNPHCESEEKSNEETKIIMPAIKKLKKKFKKIDGPFSTDSLFMKNNLSKFDVVLGMYHDQVLTPAKALNNFDAINITLGLPFIRVSPDHGPNNQMLGKNISNYKSLLAAIKFLN